jgi:hypothetical protein
MGTYVVPETCRELKNRINKSIKSGASSWFSDRNIARCTGNKTLNRKPCSGDHPAEKHRTL